MNTIFEILTFWFKAMGQLLMWTWWIIVPIVGLLAYQNFRKKKWVENLEVIVLSVKIPKNSEKGPIAAEMMFASLHSILKPAQDLKKEGSIQEHISFEIVADSESINFYVWTPKHLQNFVEGQIYAQYPTAEIATVDDYARNIDIDNDGTDDCVAGCELNLTKEDYFPIKTFLNFEVDPLAGITGALSKIEDHAERMWIQILVRPTSDEWRKRGLAYADGLKGTGGKASLTSLAGIWGFIKSAPAFLVSSIIDALVPGEKSSGKGGEKKLSKNLETSLACLEEKANKLGFQVKIRLIYVAKSRELAKEHLRITSGAFKQFNATHINGFNITKIRTGREVLDEYRSRLFADKGYILNIEEIASLYHLPHVSVETPNIVWTSSKKGEPPANIPYVGTAEDEDDLTVFAETTFRGKRRAFGIKSEDRMRHVYTLGKSGTGKSKLLEMMAASDVAKGRAIGIVDPHGDLIEDTLKHIPPERVKDVVYINPADKEFPIGFNPMQTTPDMREGTASGFVSVFKKLFGFSWGPRMEYLMRYTILALTYYPDATMLDVVKMLTDKAYRKKVLEYVEDPVVLTFWTKEFSTYNDKFATEAVSPILNKVGQFTASPIIRNIIGQTDDTFKFEEAMDNGKIILVDLSGGKIGEDNSELLGSLMITKIQLAAMSRANIPDEDRKDFYLYVDEFQNFATEAFAKILSEARKYRLSLTLANQYVAQMDETVRDAVFGNVGTLISFRVGATDAVVLEKEFSPVFEKDDLINLDNQDMYLNMLIDGVASTSFSAHSLDIGTAVTNYDTIDEIVAYSRKKYSKPRAEIEEKIRKWSNVDNIDIDKAIDKQNESKFDRDDYTKRGDRKATERPQGRDRKTPTHVVTDRSNRPARHDSGSSGRSSYQPVEKQPIKKSVDPEELKKIIEKVTKPTAEKTQTDKSGGATTPAKDSVKKEIKLDSVKTERVGDRGVEKKEDSKPLINHTDNKEKSGSGKTDTPPPLNKKEEKTQDIKPGETVYFK